MITGIGIDIVKIDRFNMTRDFIERILHPGEIELWEQLCDRNQQKQFLAGRWAIKEAMFKAMKKPKVNWNQINVQLVDDNLVWLNNSMNIWLSISHEAEYAVGMAILTI